MRYCWTIVSLCSACFLGCASSQGPGADEPAVRKELSTAQLINIADALEARGDNLRAGQYLNRATEQGADEAVVVPKLLGLYVKDGQYRLAIDRGENYLRRHPRDYRTRFFLGTLYAGIGATTKAAEAFERVIKEEPDNADAHFALAAILLDEGRDLGRADTHFREYLRILPDGPHAEEASASLLHEVP